MTSQIHKHNSSEKETINTNLMNKFLIDGKTKGTRNLEVKAAELKLCGIFAEHNFSFNAMDHALKNCFPNSDILKGVNLKRTKAAAITKNVIATYERENLISALNSVKFSILIDESTDVSTKKTCVIVVRYFDSTVGKITSRLFDLVEVFKDDNIKATADHLYTLVCNTMKEKNVNMKNLIGFGADGCNTMFGEHNSFTSRLKKDFPGIITVKCICHSLHLCASTACEQLPAECEKLARNIYNFFKNSSNRQANFQQFQAFAEVEVHKILKPSQTRWLSIATVSQRILEQWYALKLYFTDRWLGGHVVSSEEIYFALNDPFMELYYCFLSWVLPKISNINQYFQSDKIVILNLHRRMQEEFQDLLLSYLRYDYVTSRELNAIDPANSSYFKNKKSLYLGATLADKLGNPLIKNDSDKLEGFLGNCQQFLCVLCCQLKLRYNFGNDNVLSKLNIFLPKNVLSLQFREQYPTLVEHLKQFPRLSLTECRQKIDDEWRRFPLHCNLPDSSLDIDVFYNQVLDIKNDADELLFSNLATFVLNILSLPHSNAECERQFSRVNLIKTKARNRLNIQTLSGILLAGQHVRANGSCTNFQPPLEMIKMCNTKMYEHKSETVSNIEPSNEEPTLGSIFDTEF
ncbi:hat family dimerization domaincontaining protein-related [Holotrichia oblita]|uniref:Hat family dimerization domaincontaining protein-related n=1 Tax=Holotrichia oblita TaxID=644536 RepID=A0ACB9SJM5_HOLOL|nr:hat family dimerization domaincontaining protein-related [Holotrichia oblita]